METEKSSLNDLMKAINDLDNEIGNGELDPEKIFEKLGKKVDGIKLFLDNCDSRAEFFEKEADEFLSAASARRNLAKRMREYYAFNMKQNNFEKLPGQRWYVRLMSRDTIKVKREPTAKDMLEMPDFVERKTIYKWKKKDLETAWKCKSVSADLCEKRSTPYIKFWTKKEN